MNNITLIDVIAELESSNNQYALRFESELMLITYNSEILNTIIKYNQCDEITAKMIYNTSWGLYQIMGFNLYSMGLKTNVIAYCAEKSIQTIYFIQFLSENNINFKIQDMLQNNNLMASFIKTYNGNGTEQEFKDYKSKIIQIYNQLSGGN